MNFIKTLLSLIFPLECRICKKTLEAENLTYICPECFTKIRFIKEPHCLKCGQPLRPFENKVCKNCQKEKLYFKKIYSMGLYRGVLREAILLLKYQKVKALISPLGKLFLKYCQENLKTSNFDIVLPVPLYRSKRREREFNQAEVFARIIAKHYSLSLAPKNLLRIRDTRKMSGLSREKRKRNVRDAFLVKRKEEVKNKRIFLIDDICTTGATVDECSRILLQAGVKEVTVLTLARTLSKIWLIFKDMIS